MEATAQDMKLIDGIFMMNIDPSRPYESTFDLTKLAREGALFAAKSPLDEEEDDEEEDEDDDDEFEDDDLEDEEEDDDEFEDDDEEFDDEEDEEEDTDDDPKPLRVKTRL